MTHEDYVKLFEVLDDRYVRTKDCDERQESVNKKFANDDKRIEIVISEFSVLKKLLWIIATSAVGGLVMAILNLIMK